MDTGVTTAQEAMEKARRELTKDPSAYLDEYRGPCELIIRERGVQELVRVTGLPRSTVRGWAKRRGLLAKKNGLRRSRPAGNPAPTEIAYPENIQSEDDLT